MKLTQDSKALEAVDKILVANNIAECKVEHDGKLTVIEVIEKRRRVAYKAE